MGAGPAGLAAGYKLSKHGEKPYLVDKDSQVGGISKTIKYKDFYFDLGGHRFFTKIKPVNNLWNEVLKEDFRSTNRLSRIYYRNQFFDYPLSPSNALTGLGIVEAFRIFLSYLK